MDGLNALMATDEIYNAALQILSGYGVDTKLIPLVMGTVSHRIESFATGDLARELEDAKRQPETTETEE